MPDDEGTALDGDEAEDDLLGGVWVELERSADDFRRLTDRFTQQKVTVERLETLVTEVLELLPAPVVVVDADGHVAAASRGAEDSYPGVSQARLGEPITSVLPAQLANDIMAVARAHGPASPDRPADRGPEEVARWVTVRGAKVTPLPSGWALALLSA